MGEQREQQLRAGAVREADIEPYTALRWVGTLFKAAAVFLAVALVAEFIAGLQIDGTAALPELLGELARTAVLAVVLWGGGDLVRLLIHLGHDVRAQRILLARVGHRLPSSRAGVRGEAAGRTPESRLGRAAGGGGSGGADLRIERSDAGPRPAPDRPPPAREANPGRAS
jgi:hypothetical protein